MAHTVLDPKPPPLLLQGHSLPLLFLHAEEETPPPAGRDQRDISIGALGHLPAAFCIPPVTQQQFWMKTTWKIKVTPRPARGLCGSLGFTEGSRTLLWEQLGFRRIFKWNYQICKCFLEIIFLFQPRIILPSTLNLCAFLSQCSHGPWHKAEGRNIFLLLSLNFESGYLQSELFIKFVLM